MLLQICQTVQEVKSDATSPMRHLSMVKTSHLNCSTGPALERMDVS